MQPDVLPTPAITHCRAARRLARLFRIERVGGFDRRSEEVVQRLLERRAAIIGELLALALAPPDTPQRSADITDALRELAAEVAQSQSRAQERHDVLASELRFRRSSGLTGLRDGTTGHLLGRG